MAVTAKAVAKALLPPIVVDASRLFRPKPAPAIAPALPYEFSEPYPSWAAAEADAQGYDAPHILAKVRAAALKARAGEIAYEQEGIEFSEPSPKWEMLACLMTALAASPRRPPHVIDFGGSLGTLYYRHRAFLDGVNWSIVEQPSFAEVGAAEFADERMRFYDTLESALARGPADVLLCGGVLQVIAEPFGLVRRAAEAKVPFLLIDRHPLYDIPEDAIVILRVKAEVYQASYAYTQFARSRFEGQLGDAGYEVIQRYERDKRDGFLCELKT